MSHTLEASRKLDVLVDRISIGFIIIVILIMVSGSIMLTKRIFKPTFALIRMARKFGHGDFGVQAQVYRNDELGLLSATFNDMAKNIHDLQQERMNFVASIAHDLKNPIVMIGMSAHRLKKKLDIAEKEAFWLDNIIEQTDYLENMINDLMDTMQVELGNFTLNFSHIDLGTFVGAIQCKQNEIITTHEIVLESASECRVNCDAKRLERAISNLISNAVKYSPKQTSVFLNVSTKDEWGIISIRDEGVGMEKHEIDSIFKPFSRLSRTCDMAKGTGMGMFSVQKIVEGHGGSIEVRSKPGRGTTFEIRLPLIGRDVPLIIPYYTENNN
jgi:signal transduction histidine kinase